MPCAFRCPEDRLAEICVRSCFALCQKTDAVLNTLVQSLQGKGKAAKPAGKAGNVLQPFSSQNQAGKSIEDIYQKKTQLEHILLRPDTYIGSTEKQQQQVPAD